MVSGDFYSRGLSINTRDFFRRLARRVDVLPFLG